jgi:hypothetical protein
LKTHHIRARHALPGSASPGVDSNGSDIRGIQGKAGVSLALPLRGTIHGTIPGSLCAVVQNFKSVTTRKINQFRRTPTHPVWQRNYYEHVIRPAYMVDNPVKWADDENFGNVAILARSD